MAIFLTIFPISFIEVEGDWKDGKRNDLGVYKSANGDVYEGDYQDSKMNGKGAMKYANGGVYEGGWKDNEKKWQRSV